MRLPALALAVCTCVPGLNGRFLFSQPLASLVIFSPVFHGFSGKKKLSCRPFPLGRKVLGVPIGAAGPFAVWAYLCSNFCQVCDGLPLGWAVVLAVHRTVKHPFINSLTHSLAGGVVPKRATDTGSLLTVGIGPDQLAHWSSKCSRKWVQFARAIGPDGLKAPPLVSHCQVTRPVVLDTICHALLRSDTLHP